jgi:succinyl-CoA synthetase beta subunit
MPKLYEYQGKRILGKYMSIPRGGVASTPSKAAEIAEQLGGPVVIKVQAGITGRAQAGGIKFAQNPLEAEKIAKDLIGCEIKGLKIDKVLVEEKLAIKDEFYISVIMNDSWKIKGPLLMFSIHGGTGIEEIAKKFPETIVSSTIDVLKGFNVGEAEELVGKLGLSSFLKGQLGKAVYGLWMAFKEYSARSAEINPLVLTEDDDIYVADCHIVIDEASVFRHPELEINYPRDLGREPTELEELAWEVEKKDYRGIGYFAQMTRDFGPGEGVVGFHGIGGGGAMLGADALLRHGLKLADYADTSGNPTASKVYRIVKLIFSQPNIDGYVLMGACVANQEQWHHAHALVRALREELQDKPGFPAILLIAGNKESESLEILRKGLNDLPAKVEIYGRDYVYNVDYIAERMKMLVDQYRAE